MKKLTILKTIVDIFWIISILSIPLILAFLVFTIFDNSLVGKPMTVNGIRFRKFNWVSKMLLANSLIAYLTLVYALHLFRKILRYFQKNLLFDSYAIKTLNIIGIIFLVTSFFDSGIGFLYKLVRQKSMNLEYGLNSFVVLCILGLFFMILSEVFKIAKATEEENELTI